MADGNRPGYFIPQEIISEAIKCEGKMREGVYIEGSRVLEIQYGDRIVRFNPVRKEDVRVQSPANSGGAVEELRALAEEMVKMPGTIKPVGNHLIKNAHIAIPESALGTPGAFQLTCQALIVSPDTLAALDSKIATCQTAYNYNDTVVKVCTERLRAAVDERGRSQVELESLLADRSRMVNREDLYGTAKANGSSAEGAKSSDPQTNSPRSRDFEGGGR